MERDETEIFRMRVRDAIQNGGGVSVVAKMTGIPLGTINKYVALTSTASFINAAKIASALNISLEDMAFGSKGQGRKKAQQLPVAKVMKKLARIVMKVHAEAGVKLLPEDVTSEATELYIELSTRVQNLSDMEEVEAVFPQLELHLKRRLADAVAEPGSGKEKAS